MATIRLTFGQYLAVLGILVVVVMNSRPCVSQLTCVPREYLVYEAQKSGCRAQTITTMACYGRCHTSEIPQLLPPYKVSDHDMCSYDQTVERQIQLSDCDPGVDPTFTYLDAVTCVCKRCQRDTTHCHGI
ncbi:glycoprotein hormone beta-5-like [Patiria miniata]|uniref:CTCK domain-containing protein n=1 Tax=Patiria miniata TaxID=46514 RepID=A0A914BBS1_PATMI|nr:glycoprotein hormone beta-5-like [Patiria miniata]